VRVADENSLTVMSASLPASDPAERRAGFYNDSLRSDSFRALGSAASGKPYSRSREFLCRKTPGAWNAALQLCIASQTLLCPPQTPFFFSCQSCPQEETRPPLPGLDAGVASGMGSNVSKMPRGRRGPANMRLPGDGLLDPGMPMDPTPDSKFRPNHISRNARTRGSLLDISGEAGTR